MSTTAYSSAEVKSGVFITLSILLLLGLLVIVGRFMSGETHTYQVRFGYISGLEEKAPVYYAGREAGKVTKIAIFSGEERPVLVTVAIASHVKLRDDSQAYVDTLGLMGEKFVELTPGSGAAGFRENTEVVEGTDPIPMHLIVRKMNLLADRMDELTTSLNPLVNRMDHIMAEHGDEMGGLIDNLNSATGTVDGLLTDKRSELADAISKLNETATNVRDMTEDLKTHPWRLLRKN